MKKIIDNDIMPEYDFSKAKKVGTKYSKRLKEGSNVVIIEPALRKSFPNSRAVNTALKKYLQIRKAAS